LETTFGDIQKMKLVIASQPKINSLNVVSVDTRTKAILRGEEYTLKGKITTHDERSHYNSKLDFDTEFPIYHSLAVLATFLDLPDDPERREIQYASKRRTVPQMEKPQEPPENLRLVRPADAWGVTMSLKRKSQHDDPSFACGADYWYTYIATIYGEDRSSKLNLPLLEIIRLYSYNDSAEGYSPHTERKYFMQLHDPGILSFKYNDRNLKHALEKMKGRSAVSYGGRTAYNHTDNQGFYSLGDIKKEPEVKDALTTLIKTHPRWKDKPLSLFNLQGIHL
jgi:hypothetical protein